MPKEEKMEVKRFRIAENIFDESPGKDFSSVITSMKQILNTIKEIELLFNSASKTQHEENISRAFIRVVKFAGL